MLSLSFAREKGLNRVLQRTAKDWPRSIIPATITTTQHQTLRFAHRGGGESESKVTYLDTDLKTLRSIYPNTEFHNPLVDLELKEAERIQKAKDERIKSTNNMEYTDLIPKNLGERPLNFADEYLKRKIEFLIDHEGIEKTMTPKFWREINIDNVMTLADSFKPVLIFTNIKRSDMKDPRVVRVLQAEFSFRDPRKTKAYYLDLLTVYVGMLRRMDRMKRMNLLDDFYLMIKAIRKRPDIHAKLVKKSEFAKLVLSYMLLAHQRDLALTVAVDIYPKSVPENMERWHAVQLMGLSRMYDSTPESIEVKRKIKHNLYESITQLSNNEHRFRVLARTIGAFYSELHYKDMTDWELISAIRMLEAKEQVSSLLDLISCIVARLVHGSVDPNTVTELYYGRESHRTWSTSGVEIVCRYALALCRLGQYAKLDRLMSVVEEIPSKPLLGMRGTSHNLASGVKAAMSAIESNKDYDNSYKEVVTAAFKHFACMEPGYSEHLNSSRQNYLAPKAASAAVFKAWLAENIVEGLQAGKYSKSIAATAILGHLTHRLTKFTTAAVTNKLLQDCERGHALFLLWASQCINMFDVTARTEMIEKCTSLLKRGDALPLLSQTFELTPNALWINVVRLVHTISRNLKATLSKAMVHMMELSAGNVHAQGILIVSLASPGEAKLETISVSARMKTLANAIERIDFTPKKEDGPLVSEEAIKEREMAEEEGRIANAKEHAAKKGHNSLSTPRFNSKAKGGQDKLQEQAKAPKPSEIAMLLPYLHRAAVELESVEMDRLILREMLRRGISPAWHNIQLGLKLRGITASNGQQALEMAKCALEMAGDWAQSHFTQTFSNLYPGNADANAIRIGSLYMSILTMLNRRGYINQLAQLSEYIISNPKGINGRTFGAIAANWIDALGFDETSTAEKIHLTWNGLASSAKGNEEWSLNRNNYHGLIEAFVRKGEVSWAWDVIQDMVRSGVQPDAMTFYTLVAPLAANNKLWTVGKTVVERFKNQYPAIVEMVENDPRAALNVKTFLQFSIKN